MHVVVVRVCMHVRMYAMRLWMRMVAKNAGLWLQYFKKKRKKEKK